MRREYQISAAEFAAGSNVDQTGLDHYAGLYAKWAEARNRCVVAFHNSDDASSRQFELADRREKSHRDELDTFAQQSYKAKDSEESRIKKEIDDLRDRLEFIKGVNTIVRTKPRNKPTDEKLHLLRGLGVARPVEKFDVQNPGLSGYATAETVNLRRRARARELRLQMIKLLRTISEWPDETIPFEDGSVVLCWSVDQLQIRHSIAMSGGPFTSGGFKWSDEGQLWYRKLTLKGALNWGSVAAAQAVTGVDLFDQTTITDADRRLAGEGE